MIRKIVSAKNPALRKKCKPVKKVDKKVLSIVKDLKDTLSVQKDPEGVGLAAPQIGKHLRVFAAKIEGKIEVFINPEIISISKKKASKTSKKERAIMEGCLSILNYYAPLSRAKKIRIKYLTPDGKKRTRSLEGLSAQIVQHEIDHLNGILFVDRLLEQKRPLYKLEGEEWEEVDFADF
jgi:peptide deformylase